MSFLFIYELKLNHISYIHIGRIHYSLNELDPLPVFMWIDLLFFPLDFVVNHMSEFCTVPRVFFFFLF